MPQREANRTNLLEAFFRGDAKAEVRLAEELRPELLIVARDRLGAQHLDVEDVVHDVLLHLFDHLRRRGEFSGNLLGYAVTMTKNRCIDILRHRSLVRSAEPIEFQGSGHFFDALDTILAKEAASRLGEAIEQLGLEDRKFLHDHYLQGKSIRQLTDEAELGSVQFLYYRRRKCLNELARILKLTS
jgi:RNA polymerase sigma factor (sigma-70 family)